VRTELAAAAAASPASFTDIRFERRRGVVILRQRNRLESVAERVSDQGLVRCLSPGFAWGSCGFTQGNDLPGALRLAHESSLALPRRRPLALQPLPAREAEALCPAEADPSAVPLTRKLELTELVAEALLAADRRIVDARVQYTDEMVETVLVTSEGVALVEQRPEFTLSLLCAAEESGTVERVVDSIAARSWAEVEAWAGNLKATAERAVLMLYATPVRAGRYPVVLGNRAAGLLAHRAVGHLCQADGDRDHPAPLPLGTRLGPESLTVEDDPTVIGMRGTRSFDHEGLQPRKTTLVQNGVVVGHLHTRSSAAAAGAAPTGSAFGGGGDVPRARLSNTYLTAGKAAPSDLMAGIEAGVLIEDVVSASLDQHRVGLRAGFARMIRQGQPAEPVKGVSLADSILALLGQIDLVAGDFQWDGTASWCDRLGAGRAPVSTGAPHVRLIDVAVGEPA
jgi:TldD protein